MSELQPEDNYEYESEDDVTTETEVEETVDSVEEQDSDSAPEAEDTQDKQIKFDEQQQRIFDEAVGKKVFKLREKEREAEALKKQLEELQAKLGEKQAPKVPDLPDPFSVSEFEYRQGLERREQALRASAQYEMEQQAIQQQQQALKQQEWQKQQEEMTTKVKSYSDRATKFGITPEQLQEAGNAVAQFGIDESLVNIILDETDGPLITKYLAKNPLELDALRYLPPAQAAVRIATEIKQKAASLKPKVNNAPDPLEQPHGCLLYTSPSPRD
jgi:multidrug efflux pump subunit AcrB